MGRNFWHPLDNSFLSNISAYSFITRDVLTAEKGIKPTYFLFCLMDRVSRIIDPSRGHEFRRRRWMVRLMGIIYVEIGDRYLFRVL